MYKLKKVKIVNFRSYHGSHTFTFPAVNGLYYLTGINEVDDLGANGAGKSTFLDACVWCLYGTTSRGLKASDVLPDWEGEGTSVTLDLQVGDRSFVVKRTQKPNNLTLDDKPVDQNDLQGAIQLNFTAFIHSVLFPQFGKPFFSLGSAEKLKLFSDIMNLDFWLDCSKEAAVSADAIQTEILQQQSQISRVEGELDALKDELPSLETNEADYAKNRQANLDQIKIKMASRETAYRDLEIDLCSTDDAIAEANKDVDWAIVNVREKEKYRDLLLKEVIKFSKMVTKYEVEYKAIVAKRDELRNANSVCPICGGPLNIDHTKDEILKLSYQLAKVEVNLAETNKTTDSMNKELVQEKLRLQSCLRAQEEAQDELNKAGLEKAKIVASLDECERNYDALKDQCRELKKQENPYTNLLATKKAKLKDLISNLEEQYFHADQAEAKFVSYSFWKGGFKRLRLHIIEQAFAALTLEVNNCLTQMGMHAWSISFDIERENKSGGITSGFVVFVQSPHNKQPVKWENWSGGETQRLQLAGDLGLANLIMQQAGLSNCNEFFDEPSTHLSPEGMMDLADMLHERAISENKCIWIVDHAAVSNFGDFEGVIIARKTTNGSSIHTD